LQPTVDFAHLRSATNAGMKQKPHDAFGVSLCRAHHIEEHKLGGKTFSQKYGIDLWALAAEFVRRTPDIEMQSSLNPQQVRVGAPDPLAPGI
jgi:hypothetical protein